MSNISAQVIALQTGLVSDLWSIVFGYTGHPRLFLLAVDAVSGRIAGSGGSLPAVVSVDCREPDEWAVHLADLALSQCGRATVEAVVLAARARLTWSAFTSALERASRLVTTARAVGNGATGWRLLEDRVRIFRCLAERGIDLRAEAKEARGVALSGAMWSLGVRCAELFGSPQYQLAASQVVDLAERCKSVGFAVPAEECLFGVVKACRCP